MTGDSIDNHNGTVYGATWSSGKVNNALSFDELFYKQSLTKFCKEKLQQGYTEKQILEAAKQAGWQEETIREVLKGLK